MSETTTHQPIQISDRILVMDVLRGIALLGIFYMNIEFFNRSMFENGGGIWPGSKGWDYIAAVFVHIFVTGKFWVLFSMLFGMGFVVLQVRAQSAGRAFGMFYVRRLIALLLFGLAHIVFFWTGDILHSYALAGFGLLLFINVNPKTSFGLGIALYAGMAFMILLGGLGLSAIPAEELDKTVPQLAQMQKLGEISARVHAEGSYMQVLQQRVTDFANIFSNTFLIVIGAFGVFLIGSGILRMGWLHQLDEKRGLYVKILAVCLPIAAIFIGGSVVIGMEFPQSANPGKATIAMGVMMLGNLPMALSYLTIALLLMSYATPAKLLSIFAPAGRMALTNYLLQSVICSFVFFGYGLGYWGEWGRANQLLFATAVFMVQLIFSALWLKWFQFGPMEWLWRAISYWKIPALKRV